MRQLQCVTPLLIAGILFGCGGSSSISQKASLASTAENAVPITGSVVDAKTGDLLDATVTAVNTTTSTGLAVVTNSLGNYSVTLPQIPANDVKIAITATAKNSNYLLSNSTTVTINSASTARFYPAPSITLVNKLDAPTGVTTDSAQGNAASGLVLSSPDKTVIATIEAGTKFYDATGTLLDTATLNFVKTTFDESAMPLVPNEALSIIASAGLTDVTIRDGSGKIAVHTDKPVKMRVDIAAGTPNYDHTDAKGDPLPIAQGDIINILTYKNSTGTWEKDTTAADTKSTPALPGQATVQQDAKGMFVEYTVTHFSYWNLAFLGIAKCAASAVPDLTFSVPNASLLLKVTTSLARVKLSDGIKPPFDTTVSLRNVPRTGTTTITAYYDGNSVGTKHIQNCAYVDNNNTMTVTLPVSTVTWTVQRRCKYPLNDIPPRATQPLPYVAIYDCSATATTLDSSCRIVAATNGNGVDKGKATVSLTDITHKLFIQPSNAQKNAYGPTVVGPYNVVYGPNAVRDQMVTANAADKTITFESGQWDFCTITGAN